MSKIYCEIFLPVNTGHQITNLLAEAVYLLLYGYFQLPADTDPIRYGDQLVIPFDYVCDGAAISCGNCPEGIAGLDNISV